MRRESCAPLIVAIVLLLVPVLYVGSYLALVKPGNYWNNSSGDGVKIHGYRYFGDWSGQGDFPVTAKIAPTIFWPLEQVDRKMRPEAWEPSAQLPSPHRTTIGEDGLERIGIDFN